MLRGTRVGQAYIALTADGSDLNEDIVKSFDGVDFADLGDKHGREYEDGLRGRLPGIRATLEDAARSLGATRWRSFLEVTLPLSLPGLAAGGLLCFVLGAGTYITPLVLGGPRDAMFANLVFEAIITQLNWPLGSALSITLMIIVTLALLVYVRNTAKGGGHGHV